MVGKPCSSCNRLCQSDQFRHGKSQCLTCEGRTELSQVKSASRMNNATEAAFEQYDLDNPFAEGSFRLVAKGKYTHGKRAGEQCVCKWFKDGSVFEAHYYQTDIKTAKKAIEIIDIWNKRKYFDKLIQVNLPEIWQSCEDGRTVLQEPFIKNYQKFNSNTGWMDDHKVWFRLMQALSHFSYHITDGQSLLCDLQGGVYRDGLVLTDPVVMSQDFCFGPTDLGPKGISSFFGHHRCNQFCRPEWRTPKDRRIYYTAKRGTTMQNRQSKQKKTGLDPLPERRSRLSSSPPADSPLNESSPPGSHMSPLDPHGGLYFPQDAPVDQRRPPSMDEFNRQIPVPHTQVENRPKHYVGLSGVIDYDYESPDEPLLQPIPAYSPEVQTRPGGSWEYNQQSQPQPPQQPYPQLQSKEQRGQSPVEVGINPKPIKSINAKNQDVEMSPNSIIDEIGPSLPRPQNHPHPHGLVFPRSWPYDHDPPASCGIFFPSQPLCIGDAQRRMRGVQHEPYGRDEVKQRDYHLQGSEDESHSRKEVKQRDYHSQSSEDESYGREEVKHRGGSGRSSSRHKGRKTSQPLRPLTPKKRRDKKDEVSRRDGRTSRRDDRTPSHRTSRQHRPPQHDAPLPSILQKNRYRRRAERVSEQIDDRANTSHSSDEMEENWPLSKPGHFRSRKGPQLKQQPSVPPVSKKTVHVRQPIIQQQRAVSFVTNNATTPPVQRERSQPTMTTLPSNEDSASQEQHRVQLLQNNIPITYQYDSTQPPNNGRLPAGPKTWQNVSPFQGEQQGPLGSGVSNGSEGVQGHNPSVQQHQPNLMPNQMQTQQQPPLQQVQQQQYTQPPPPLQQSQQQQYTQPPPPPPQQSQQQQYTQHPQQQQQQQQFDHTTMPMQSSQYINTGSGPIMRGNIVQNGQLWHGDQVQQNTHFTENHSIPQPKNKFYNDGGVGGNVGMAPQPPISTPPIGQNMSLFAGEGGGGVLAYGAVPGSAHINQVGYNDNHIQQGHHIQQTTSAPPPTVNRQFYNSVSPLPQSIHPSLQQQQQQQHHHQQQGGGGPPIVLSSQYPGMMISNSSSSAPLPLPSSMYSNNNHHINNNINTRRQQNFEVNTTQFHHNHHQQQQQHHPPPQQYYQQQQQQQYPMQQTMMMGYH